MQVLRVKLREVMEERRRQTGERLTYDALAKQTGVSRATLESIATRQFYNTRLSTIEKLCVALECQPGDLLEMIEEPRQDLHEN